jgi:hypothetical protein
MPLHCCAVRLYNVACCPRAPADYGAW